MTRYIAILFLSITLYSSEINIGYSLEAMSEINKKDLKISMNVWLKEIVSASGNSASYIYYESSKKMADEFNSGNLDLVVAFALDFVRYYDRDKLVDGFRGGLKDGSQEKIVILLKKENSLESFAKLKKPRIAMKSNEEILDIYVKTRLFSKNKEYTVLETRKHSKSILKLFFNKSDMAIVTQQTFNFAKELNPQIGKQLKVVDLSNVIAGSYCFFNKNYDVKKREEFIKVALNIVNTPRGKQLLSLFKINTIVRSYVSNLKYVDELYSEYKKISRER